MSPDLGLILLSIALILGNAFFVAGEYALVSARRGRIEALAKKGNKTAIRLLDAIDNMSPYVAGIQIAITMFGIGIGTVTEPFIRDKVGALLGTNVRVEFSATLSLLVATYLTVVFGELVPKYITLQAAEKIAFIVINPLYWFVKLSKYLVIVVQASGALVLRIFGIKIGESEEDVVPKEELLMLIRSGGAAGVLEKQHADMVTRALRLDVLDAQNIMVHRLDVKWLDISLDRAGVKARLREIPFTRMPVCRGDIDDMVGIVYLHDLAVHMDDEDFSLERIARPIIAIPENLTMEKIVETMRTEKTQMLIVMDEYGGTSGIVTLEDVVEEVFGELEDRLESERPQVEAFPGGRVSARAEVRYDELISRLQLDIDPGANTDTLATMIINALDRIPRTGDAVETELGLMRVENMARRRITRVGIQLAPSLVPMNGDAPGAGSA
ncbi:MAG: hemolysin family protein [Fimbriimonas sp.]